MKLYFLLPFQSLNVVNYTDILSDIKSILLFWGQIGHDMLLFYSVLDLDPNIVYDIDIYVLNCPIIFPYLYYLHLVFISVLH